MSVGSRWVGHHTLSPHTVPTTQWVLNQCLWDEDIGVEGSVVCTVAGHDKVPPPRSPGIALFCELPLPLWGGVSTTSTFSPSSIPQPPIYTLPQEQRANRVRDLIFSPSLTLGALSQLGASSVEGEHLTSVPWVRTALKP